MRTPALRHVLTHLITPLLMCLGMGLAYMGAFVTPEPHHLPVAVVGSGRRRTGKRRRSRRPSASESWGSVAVRPRTTPAVRTEEVRPITAVSARVLSPRVDADHRR